VIHLKSADNCDFLEEDKFSSYFSDFKKSGDITNLLHESTRQKIINSQQIFHREETSCPQDPRYSRNSIKMSKRKFLNRISESDTLSSSIIKDHGAYSRTGYFPNNPLKPNQDSYIQKPDLLPATHLFGVCDGHGKEGHHVSGFLKTKIPAFIKKKLKN
jgi:hypothetical protein